MTGPPPLNYGRRAKNADHLRVLAIFHFVGAGLSFVAFGFFALNFPYFLSLLETPDMWNNQNGVPPNHEVLYLLKVFYVGLGLFLAACAVLNLLSGIFIVRRKHRTFSLVVSGLNCIHIPFGTVLGVFTFVVLRRPSVREAYEARLLTSGAFSPGGIS
jgi:uncharacterized membrane protein YidH (DUF202 family)